MHFGCGLTTVSYARVSRGCGRPMHHLLLRLCTPTTIHASFALRSNWCWRPKARGWRHSDGSEVSSSDDTN